MFCARVAGMELAFANRTAELQELETAAKAGGLLVVFGRRRVGKTRLLTHWLKPRGGLYSQAIEAASAIQIEQVMRDLGPVLKINIAPKNWGELLELISLQKKHTLFCLDEFPYLVAADPSLPSVLQRWLDHHRPKPFTLILAGSSTRAMNDCFLHRAAPLYQRARKLLHVEPMGYPAFCGACGLQPDQPESFTRFALVGGIPKYWEFVEPRATDLDLADELFFGRSAFLEDEPARTLRDENIAGLTALSVLEAVGRGAGNLGNRRPPGHRADESWAHVAATAGCQHSGPRDSVWRKPAFHQENTISHSRPGLAFLVSGLFAPPDPLVNLRAGGAGETDP